jgi:SAM-dependent methyltransferase
MNEGLKCRSCGSRHGRTILDLGVQPLANNLLKVTDLGRTEPRFPLVLALCESCWLLQITETVPPVELFSEYLYFSSFSDALLKHAAEAVQSHIRDAALTKDSFVVEIASNDGYLLKNFVAAGVPCLGIEPAGNIATVAIEKGIPTLNRFFGPELAAELAAEGRKADLILGNNVFAHVPDTNGFVAGLAALLKPEGRVVLEFPYACDLVEHLEFDTIYHEHVFYFTLTALQPLFERHGLELFQVERIPIHGGSLRLSAGHKGVRPVGESIRKLMAEEQAKGIATTKYYEAFGDKVRGLREELLTLLRRLRQEGRRVAAYGASAKGSTLLNFYGIGKQGLDCLEFVADRSTAKQGRLTPGSHLPIVPAEALVGEKPDYALLLTWNFAEEILRQQSAYREAGGKFIIPLPQVKVV